VPLVAEVSIRDLRNHGGDIVDRAAGGERVTITRSGKAVATLAPVGRTPLRLDVLRSRWRQLPAVDPEVLRHDIDETMDPGL
jgi:prevent-host-death family protein